MEARLISLPLVQLARLLGLVRRVEPVELKDSREWGLLIRGQGFTRLLEQELLLCGHEVRLTRDGPVADDELDWRAAMANDWGAEVFLCIHCNSFRKIEAEGTETYHYPGSEADERLARAIQLRICDALLTEDRGVKQDNFQVLRETDCPAVLVECGFISNPIDRAMLTDPLEQWRIAAAIAEGLADWEKGGEG